MNNFAFLAIFLVIFFICLNFVHGLSVKKVIDSPLLTEKIDTNRTIIVDVNGQGNFKSVQAAINSVPDGNSDWIIIHVRKGTYRYIALCFLLIFHNSLRIPLIISLDIYDYFIGYY